MNVIATSNVGNCDFKFYSHYVDRVAWHGMRQNLRMSANLLQTQDELKTDGFLLKVSICSNFTTFYLFFKLYDMAYYSVSLKTNTSFKFVLMKTLITFYFISDSTTCRSAQW